jgi:S1-C subfamily serine protease
MDLSQTVRKVSPSIAKLYCFDAKGDLTNTATGFLYAKKNMLVTCNHVVQGSDRIACRFPGDSDETFHTTKVVLNDTEHDLALLKVDVNRAPLTPFVKKPGNDVCSGMSVLFSGYPLNLETLTTHQGILSAITKDAVGMTTYLIDGTVNSGNSGCPLMTSTGEVIGVVNAKRRERADLLTKVEQMTLGAVSLHGIDIVEIYQALISNVQLGIGYAVPASYIPTHKEELGPPAKKPPQLKQAVKPKMAIKKSGRKK